MLKLVGLVDGFLYLSGRLWFGLVISLHRGLGFLLGLDPFYIIATYGGKVR